jgi:hypothetical protein
LGSGIVEWVGAQAPNLFCKLRRGPGKLASHGGRNIDHLDALAFKADLIE